MIAATPQLVREDSEEVTLPLVRLTREIRLPLRQFNEPALSLVHEELDGVRDRVVETRIEASELCDPFSHASRALSLLLRGLRGEEDAQDGHPEQPDLVDELGELESLVESLGSVRNGGGAHSRRARPLAPLHPCSELVQKLGNIVPEDGVREPDDARLALDESLPLAHDLVARFAEEGVNCEHHNVSSQLNIPKTRGGYRPIRQVLRGGGRRSDC